MQEDPPPSPENLGALLRLGLEEDADSAEAAADTQPLSAPMRTNPATASQPRVWEPPPVEVLQRALPQYEVTALIARGGMGAVYRGMQRALKRPVAIKVLPPEMNDAGGSDLQFAARFKQEAQAMARLSHPNIVAVFDAGEVAFQAGQGAARQSGQAGQGGTLLYFVMEFIEGTDVAQLIASEGRLSAERAAPIIAAVCEALAFAHEEGIVHRDIKPSNIMIDKRGRVKVADFGLAKAVNLESTLMTRSDVAMGTPDFVAPEALIPGMKVDGRADLYAVGVMLYQMLTGKIPRGRFELPSGVVAQVDRRFDAIVDRAMQTDREKRYSTATEMKREVESVVMVQEGSAGVPGRSHSSGGSAAEKEAPKSGRAPLLAAAAVAALGAGAWLLMEDPVEAEGVAAVSHSPSPTKPPWMDVLGGGVSPLLIKSEVGPEGLRLQGSGMLKLPVPPGPERNGIVRLKARFDKGVPGPQLRGRDAASGTKETYTLQVEAPGTVRLSHWQDMTMQGRVLQRFTPPSPLQSGQDYELELMIIGSTLVAKLNGTLLGSVEDSAIPKGLFGAGNAEKTTTQVKSLHVLNLDGFSEAETLKAAGVDAVSSSPSPQVSASSAPTWRKAITRYEDLPAEVRSKGTLRWNDGWLEPASATQSTSLVILPGPKVRNGGIRVRGRMSPDITHPSLGNVFLRRTLGADTTHQVYRAGVIGAPTSTVGLTLMNDKTKAQEELTRLTLPRTFATGDEFELELIAIGDQLHTRLNDERLPVVTDTRLKEGSLGFHTIHPMRDVEVINLDGLSETEARKAAGIE